MKAEQSGNTLHVSDEQLLGLLDGELEADEDANVRAHLEGCTACSARARLFRRLSGETNTAYRVAIRGTQALRLGLAVIATVCGLYWISTTAAEAPRPAALVSLALGDL